MCRLQTGGNPQPRLSDAWTSEEDLEDFLVLFEAHSDSSMRKYHFHQQMWPIKVKLDQIFYCGRGAKVSVVFILARLKI